NGNGNKARREKGLPSNVDAERVVLGSIMIGAADLCTVQRGLEISDFSLKKHQTIFSSMARLAARGEQIDRITLANELMHLGQLDSVDGLSYLISLDDGLPQIPNIESYLNILRQKAAYRRLMFAGAALSDGASLEIDNPRELIESHRSELEKIGVSPDTSDSVLAEVPSVWRYETETSYLVDELLVEGAVTVWTGESGDGKSTLALAMAAAVAQGQAFLGRGVKQRPVLYIDRENPVHVVKDRLFRLGIPEDCIKIWGTWWQGHEPPGPEAACVIAYVKRVKPLIVFDSLIAFACCDENSSQEMRRHMTLYRELAALGATILIIHHRSDKGDTDYRGSSDIRAVVDSGWRLSRDDGSGAGDALGRLVLKPYKTRIGPGKQVRIEYTDGGFMPVDGPVRPALDIVLELVASHPGANQKELRKLGPRQGLADQRVVDTLDAAVLARKIEVRRGKHNTLRYYPLTADMAMVV
ncbi:MAG: DnaB-like helicase N-terminal domain-containing protein, partial [Bryobacteraceae bacterium]